MKILYFANPESIHDSKWINFFAKRNHVAVICQVGANQEGFKLNEGPECHPVLPPFSFFRRRRMVDTLMKIRRILEEHEPDVIHSMYAMPNAIWADLSSEGKHLLTTRGSDVLVDYAKTYSTPKGLKQRISYRHVRKSFVRAFKNASAVTSTSYRQIEAVRKLRGSDEAIHLVRTGVDASVFKPLKAPDHGSQPVFFCPRSMKPVYNLDLLIEGFREFSTSNPDLRPRLRLIDDRPGSKYSNKIRGMLKPGETSIEFLPKMRQEQMLVQYKDADFVVMIPSSDGTPVSAIEAMMTKRAVVIGDLEYDRDLFNDQTVFKAQGFDRGMIATILEEAARAEDIKEKVDRAFESAIEFASLEKSLERIQKLYEDICESASKNQS